MVVDYYQENIKKSGIYKITNTVNNKMYIGSAKCFYNRWKSHFLELNRNNHKNEYLQSAWNKYGGDSFKIEIIELVDIISNDKNLLIEREQYWLDYYQSYDREIGYNLCPTAKNSLGYKHSEETRAKLRICNAKEKILIIVNLLLKKREKNKDWHYLVKKIMLLVKKDLKKYTKK